MIASKVLNKLDQTENNKSRNTIL